MAKKLMQTKRDYETYIAVYMHANHISFKTIEQTKQTWRQEREYSKQIEEELITKSLLFISLLDNELDIIFRKKLANFMANYLSVYTSKSNEYVNEENQKDKQYKAYTKLNNKFLLWLDKVDANKKARKAKKQQQNVTKPANHPTSNFTKHLSKKDGKIIQEIGIGDKKVAFIYDDMKQYQTNHRIDFARTISEHTM